MADLTVIRRRIESTFDVDSTFDVNSSFDVDSNFDVDSTFDVGSSLDVVPSFDVGSSFENDNVVTPKVKHKHRSRRQTGEVTTGEKFF
jgi:hypothetical protein